MSLCAVRSKMCWPTTRPFRKRCSKFDAKPLKYSKPNKVNTATHDATSDFNFVLNVAHDIGKGKGIDWLLNVLREIEDHNPQRIVIFCAQGKHRSVSAATLLKLSVYEKAVVYNLTTR